MLDLLNKLANVARNMGRICRLLKYKLNDIITVIGVHTNRPLSNRKTCQWICNAI